VGEVSAAEVQQLRQAAGVGMMDAKRALIETDGDFDQAAELLRVRGLAKAAKRAEREASEGTIGSYIHYQSERPVTGVLVQLTCETDFVAKNADFRQVADDIAMHIAWANPRWTRRDEADPAVVGEETDIFTRQAKEEGKPDGVIPRIVEGRMQSFYEENVLYDQKFVNTQKFEGTIEEMVQQLGMRMGENIGVRGFARLSVGEQVDK
jgi:elongation factor Ts